MKGKSLALLLLAAAIAAAAWLALSKQNRSAWNQSGASAGKLVEFPLNDVTRVTLRNATGEVNLVRKGETWTVRERADYPASFEQVSALVRKLWELKAVQELKAGPSQHARLELIEPGKGDGAGLLLELAGADDKPLASLVLGKPHLRKSDGGDEMGMGMGGFPTGRYLLVPRSGRVALVGDPLDETDPRPERWISKEFFRIESPKTIAVTGIDGAPRWSVSRESATGEWKFADAQPDEKIDAAKASPLGSLLASASFTDVLAPDAKPEETGLDKPLVATIETFDGFRYTLNIGKTQNESLPLRLEVSATLPAERTAAPDEKPEDKTRLDEEFKNRQEKLKEKLAAEQKLAGRVYLVPKFSLDALVKERSAWLPDKPAEPAAAAAPAASPAPSPISVTTPPITVGPDGKMQTVTTPSPGASPKPATKATPKPR